jgi:hypothetical protein
VSKNSSAGESSNGRKAVFETVNVGSTPTSPSISRREYLKNYQQTYQKDRYQKNPAYYAARNTRAEREKRKWFDDEIVAKSKCLKCGENHPGCLDFHHRDPSDKHMEVTKMVKAKCSKAKILKEIAKCDVLCANCHRKLHYEERKK